MKIAVASGKGGTGKTTISTNLAAVLSGEGLVVRFLDCDVEEPNGHVFLRPEIAEVRDVNVGVPLVNKDRCTGCGKCADFCRYNALACVKGEVLVFEELCHYCGGCMVVCPEGAISEKDRKVGVVEVGRCAFGGVDTADGGSSAEFGAGLLEIGAIQTTAVIGEVKKLAGVDDEVVIIDAPPGTSCPVIEAVEGSDFVLLVTEPTPFGLNDLKLAVEMVRALGLKFGVAINRSDVGDGSVKVYCEDEGIDVMLEVPNDRRIAEKYSDSVMMVDAFGEYREKFRGLYEKIAKAVEK